MRQNPYVLELTGYPGGQVPPMRSTHPLPQRFLLSASPTPAFFLISAAGRSAQQQYCVDRASRFEALNFLF
jgi:hypothetical protein